MYYLMHFTQHFPVRVRLMLTNILALSLNRPDRNFNSFVTGNVWRTYYCYIYIYFFSRLQTKYPWKQVTAFSNPGDWMIFATHCCNVASRYVVTCQH